ncbi:gephyrin-like molybdotransferase Glp [Balneola sp. MJW-20]|uniref:molybdopterin molybdotransferase MoeA n=1 Tax=Gracilimonas aurantiaca TaxID=3234185 RepID=UPI003467785E
MISIEEALQHIQQQAVKPNREMVSLDHASGYILAEEIRAPFDLPSFDNSAMDGYAVCGDHSVFTIIGEVAAGSTEAHSLRDGEAMRIFTGGKVPQNTTAVIMQEKTDVAGDQLRIEGRVESGRNIRRKGNELSEGQLVFEAGHRINPPSAGLIASLGFDKIAVYKKPTVTIIATGDELIDPGQERKEGQIYDSNSKVLSMVLHDFGYEAAAIHKIKDELAATRSGIEAALRSCDVLLISGGISVGDYDFTKQALEDNGVEQVFYKVFQKPGKPLYFGKKGDQYVFALPGNPASSLTCFYVYVLPMLQRLCGGKGQGLKRIDLPLSHDYVVSYDRPVFLKTKVNENEAEILDGQGSSMIHSMAQGNALAYVKGPADLKAGDKVQCLLME